MKITHTVIYVYISIVKYMKLMLVDDESLALYQLQRMLSGYSWRVRLVSECGEAIERMPKLQPDVIPFGSASQWSLQLLLLLYLDVEAVDSRI
ncbi:hypothetical protein GC102_15750 [Paenibacillus sp. LMG 31460]|uniref:Response regulatory domain-containing protein n=1 Tax=Paenibacillus germinis TaxID=2654979 RepID=A0ABX1Z201_9BACL|nr:hypothetical protein [Paenibacillus germinis]NOU87228.1 hypothetical protein [Paenibacillus germinis]